TLKGWTRSASERVETRKASERFGGRASGAPEGEGSSDALKPGWARGGATRGASALVCRLSLELPSAVRAQMRIERVVQKQKQTILRHKHLLTLHTQIYTYTRDPQPQVSTLVRAHAHTYTHPSHKLLKRKAIHRIAPSSPTVLLCPFLRKLATTQQRTVRTFENKWTYKNRPFVWIILYIKCSKSCLISTYNETFFFLKRKHQKKEA
ncbi:hypothetical protein H1C71_020295, partial [Ictidomys tridecemlineatus]